MTCLCVVWRACVCVCVCARGVWLGQLGGLQGKSRAQLCEALAVKCRSQPHCQSLASKRGAFFMRGCCRPGMAAVTGRTFNAQQQLGQSCRACNPHPLPTPPDNPPPHMSIRPHIHNHT